MNKTHPHLVLVNDMAQPKPKTLPLTPDELLAESEARLQKRLKGRSTERLDRLAKDAFDPKKQEEYFSHLDHHKKEEESSEE